MTWMITGASGQLGRCLQDTLKITRRSFISLSSAALDISDKTLLLSVLNQVKPTVIFNCAGYTDIQRAESDQQRLQALNLDAPETLAIWCRQHNALLIHISSDYIFSGEHPYLYTEDDPVGPLSAYGKSKLAAETIIQQFCPRHIIARSSWLFSEYRSNLVQSVLMAALMRQPMSASTEQTSTPTPAHALARVLVSMAAREEARMIPSGIYHYAGDTAVSRYDFTRTVLAEAYAMGCLQHLPEVRKVAGTPFSGNALLPQNSALNSGKMEGYGFHAPDWRAALPEVITALCASARTQALRSYTTKL